MLPDSTKVETTLWNAGQGHDLCRSSLEIKVVVRAAYEVLPSGSVLGIIQRLLDYGEEPVGTVELCVVHRVELRLLLPRHHPLMAWLNHSRRLTVVRVGVGFLFTIFKLALHDSVDAMFTISHEGVHELDLSSGSALRSSHVRFTYFALCHP
jgi:hypothetical protein